MTIPRKGITATRKESWKIQFILEHHSSMSRKDIAKRLRETPRWVKRQIHTLIEEGKISQKRKKPDTVLSKKDWTPARVSYVRHLRQDKLLTYEEIAPLFQDKFGIAASGTAIGWWARKYGVRDYGKKEWLADNYPKGKMQELLESGMTLTEMSRHIEELKGLYFSSDLILEHIQRLGLESQKNRGIRLARERVAEVEKVWLDDKIKSHASLKEISNEIGVSTTLLARRMKKDGLTAVLHRKVWSQNLEKLRNILLLSPPIKVTPSDEDYHQMVLGWLAGDGSLTTTGRFVVAHSLKQLHYLYVKYQVLREHVTSVMTNASDHYAQKGRILGGGEQMAFSCSGMQDYVPYLNEDGSKNFHKIFKEMQDLGWACYFMDDGSFFGGTRLISMRKALVDEMQNKYRFSCMHEKSRALTLQDGAIDPSYVLPAFSSKIQADTEVGSYWRKHFPELFDIVFENDLSLSFVDEVMCEADSTLLTRAVDYYHGRGFPTFEISDVYLEREYDLLKRLDTKYLWKEEHVIRYNAVGNGVFKHFMPHMSEAKYRQTSPVKTFEGHETLRSILSYTLRRKQPILPDYVHDSLVHFGGGVTGFSCSLAKAIVSKYTKPGDVVVDPCAGWGGRLLGTVAASRKYVGFEPWKKTSDALVRISDFIKADAKVCPQEFSLEGAPSDCSLVLTSPPYMDLEEYGYEMSRERWHALMCEIFTYAEKALHSGGFLILNLPSHLRDLLPDTPLHEEKAIYWFSSPRRRSLKKAEVAFVWRK